MKIIYQKEAYPKKLESVPGSLKRLSYDLIMKQLEVESLTRSGHDDVITKRKSCSGTGRNRSDGHNDNHPNNFYSSVFCFLGYGKKYTNIK